MPYISAHIDLYQFKFDSTTFNEITDSIQQDSSNDCENSAVKTNHQLGLFALIKRSRPMNLITGPIIYSMLLPIGLLDLCVSFYQWSCFPIYGIPKITRSKYIIFDRQELKYLDWISKFHCTYCAYGVGVVSFAKEVISATETYFCPIKHQKRKINENHHSWQRIGFEQEADFDFDAKLNKIRIEMTKIGKDQ
jgi:hypothetical protein